MKRVLVVLFVAAGVFALEPLGKRPLPNPANPKVPPKTAPVVDEKPEPDRWQVRLADGKTVAFEPAEESVKLETKFGTLTVPMTDVKRLEFGFRLSANDRKALADALADVVGGNARTRGAGVEVLLGLGLKAYPAVNRAVATAPREALPFLTQVRDKLKRLIEDEDDTPHDQDVIVTADGSRLCGTLANEAVRVKLDGKEQAIKWTDAKVLAFGKIESEEKVELVTLDANGVYGLMTTHFEKVVGVQVTGNAQAGSVWGTGPYTTDSALAAAAVHAGALKDGETGVVKIRVKADAGGYAGSTQNGVTTSGWGPYSGCFEVVGKRKKK